MLLLLHFLLCAPCFRNRVGICGVMDLNHKKNQKHKAKISSKGSGLSTATATRQHVSSEHVNTSTSVFSIQYFSTTGKSANEIRLNQASGNFIVRISVFLFLVK